MAETSRETIHRLLTVVLPEAGASRATVINTRTCLSAMLQMAWDHGYRSDNPIQGLSLEHPPAKPMKWARTQAHIAKDLNDSTTRFARLHTEKDPELAAARQQSETANRQRDFAKRELDRYRHIIYPRYLRRLVTG